MFNLVKKLKEIGEKRQQEKLLALNSEIDWLIGLSRGLVERYNRALLNGDITSASFYEQELVEKEKRLEVLRKRVSAC